MKWFSAAGESNGTPSLAEVKGVTEVKGVQDIQGPRGLLLQVRRPHVGAGVLNPFSRFLAQENEKSFQALLCPILRNVKQPFDPATRALTTGKWRDVDMGGYARPEASMIGVQYVHYPVNADMIVKNTNHFLFAGTGLVDGARLTRMVGYEADQIAPSSPSNIIGLGGDPGRHRLQ